MGVCQIDRSIAWEVTDTNLQNTFTWSSDVISSRAKRCSLLQLQRSRIFAKLQQVKEWRHCHASWHRHNSLFKPTRGAALHMAMHNDISRLLSRPRPYPDPKKRKNYTTWVRSCLIFQFWPSQSCTWCYLGDIWKFLCPMYGKMTWQKIFNKNPSKMYKINVLLRKSPVLTILIQNTVEPAVIEVQK